MWAWRKLEKINWTRRIRNEEVLRMIGEERQLLETIRSKRNWIGHVIRRECLLKGMIEGTVQGMSRRGRKRKKLLDELIKEDGYAGLRERVRNREKWREEG